MSAKPHGKGARTRQQVLEAAYSLFLERGFAATSMREISARSGLALGGIYNHFNSKEELFSEILLARHPFFQMLPVLQSAPGDTVEEFVRHAARAMVEQLGRQPDFIKLLFIELVEFDGRDLPCIFELIFPQLLPLIQRFSGDDLKPIPPSTLFRAFLGLFLSYYMTGLLLPNAYEGTQTDALDHFVEIFLRGALKSEEGA